MSTNKLLDVMYGNKKAKFGLKKISNRWSFLKKVFSWLIPK
jgi:hypothetical protein